MACEILYVVALDTSTSPDMDMTAHAYVHESSTWDISTYNFTRHMINPA